MYRSVWLVLVTALFAVACGDSPSGDDGGLDAATVSDCTDQPDGTSCGAGRVCTAGTCVSVGGECGDGTVDDGEQCDDGNSIAFDGCEPVSCTFTCEADGECDDGRECNGPESCSADHVCAAGTPPAAGSACTMAAGGGGVCRGADCVTSGCGNGVPDSGEDCDDGNDVEGDGCDNDCSFSCTEDSQCTDGDICNGGETCDTTTSHACLAGTDGLDCVDGDDCTMDLCDPVDGCSNPLIDEDGDGHAPDSLGSCGDDCDDGDVTTYSGAPELCEPPGMTAVDNDCDPSTPNPSASLWFLDCDEDSFSVVGAPSSMSCAEPAPQGGCGWTTRVPVSGSDTTVDCNDGNANMYPGQTMYFTSAHTSSASGDDARYGSYDCNGTAQHEFSGSALGAGATPSCTPRISRLGSSAYCSGSSGWIADSVPACGSSGTYTTCGALVECTRTPCRGYTLMCEGASLRPGDPCYCASAPCTPSCTPGSRGCPWHYYRCNRSTAAEQMGCR